MFKHEDELPLALTVEQVKEILQIGTTSAYELFASGEFHVVRIGKQMRVSKREFLRWLYGEQEITS